MTLRVSEHAMTRFALLACLSLTLAACGADGPPTAPTGKAQTGTPEPGISVTGETSVGVVMQ